MFKQRSGIVAAALAGAMLVCDAPLRAATLPSVSFSTVTTNGYGTDDLNAVAIDRDTLATVGNYQYMAYFGYSSNSNAPIYVARRAVGTNTWTSVKTPYSDIVGTDTVGTDSIITNGIDDHDVVSMAVDGNGDMHLSWGMHNTALNYAISGPVNGSTFSPSFTTQTSTNNPTLFSQLGSIDQATYPEFYYELNSSGQPNGNLLFDYRDAASSTGGGSGNGNTFFGTYNASTKSFNSINEVLNGGATSVNAYQNSLVYDTHGNLLMSWTWRGSASTFQTNQNIMFAQSPDNGSTWYRQGGSSQYTLPVVASQVSGTTANQVAQVVENIPQGSSLINTTSMAVDTSGNPMVATWYTPNGNTNNGAVSPTNNPNRQYMLDYYTGSTWKASQITNRANDVNFDGPGTGVRDLGRPIVLVDNQDRVLVVTRSEDSGILGGPISTSLMGNNIVVYWNTMASLDSSSPQPWQSITLDSANMGEWEPTYDPLAWKADNELEMLYQPAGLVGETSNTISVLDWNEQAYFNPSPIPEPAAAAAMAMLAPAVLMRRRRRAAGA
jgi:hypothetical protein